MRSGDGRTTSAGGLAGRGYGGGAASRLPDRAGWRGAAAADLLAEVAPDLLAVTALPGESGRQMWSTTPQERRQREIGRRTDVVGLVPSRAVLRLVGASRAAPPEEWAVAHRSVGIAALATARAHTAQLPAAVPIARSLYPARADARPAGMPPPPPPPGDGT